MAASPRACTSHIAVAVCGAEFCRERLRRQRWGWRSRVSIAPGSRDRFIGDERPALLCHGVEPGELAQTHPRALGHEMEEGERPVMGTPRPTRRSAGVPCLLPWTRQG